MARLCNLKAPAQGVRQPALRQDAHEFADAVLVARLNDARVQVDGRTPTRQRLPVADDVRPFFARPLEPPVRDELIIREAHPLILNSLPLVWRVAVVVDRETRRRAGLRRAR